MLSSLLLPSVCLLKIKTNRLNLSVLVLLWWSMPGFFPTKSMGKDPPNPHPPKNLEIISPLPPGCRQYCTKKKKKVIVKNLIICFCPPAHESFHPLWSYLLLPGNDPITVELTLPLPWFLLNRNILRWFSRGYVSNYTCTFLSKVPLISTF